MNLTNTVKDGIIFEKNGFFYTRGNTNFSKYNLIGELVNTLEVSSRISAFTFVDEYLGIQNYDDGEIRIYNNNNFEFIKSFDTGNLLEKAYFQNAFMIAIEEQEYLKIDLPNFKESRIYCDYDGNGNYNKTNKVNSINFQFETIRVVINNIGIKFSNTGFSAHSFAENNQLWCIGLEEMKFEKTVDWYIPANDPNGAYFYEDGKFIVLYQTHQICIELNSGKILWETSMLIDDHHGLLENNVLYLFRHGIAYKLNASTGELLKINENVIIREANEMALKGLNRYSMPMAVNGKMYLIQGGGLHIAVYDQETLELIDLNPILRSFKNHRLGSSLFSSGNKILFTLDHVNNKMSTIEFKTIILEV